MEPSGKEVREGWDPMDMSYMQLLDAAGPTEDAPAEAEEVPPDPGEVVKIFEDAKGNLDILVDVVTNLERSFLEAKPFSAGRRPGVKREDAVANSLQSRVAATSASLGRVSRRLAAGAELLQAHVAREDSFYKQLRQLQMFWKVHLNPRVIDCPFMVDLSMPEPTAAGAGPAAAAGAARGGIIGPDSAAVAAAAATAAASSLAAGQALTGNTYELGSGSLLVPLMKDDSGALRVQLELPPERPDVNDPARVGETRLNGKGARTQIVVDSRRVHSLLLQLHRRQLWRQVAAGLERDAAALGLTGASGAGAGAAAGGAGGGGAAGTGGGGGGHPVHISLARLAAQNVLRTSDPSLAALRPLMLEHLVACRLPPPYKPPPPRPGAGPRGLAHLGGRGGGGVLSGLPLLPDLAALLNQVVFRDHQMYHLDLEAHALPYVTLRWRPCSTSMLTSAMEIRVGPSHRVLVLVRDGRTDVEGVVQATGAAAGSGAGGSRWVRDTHMGFSRHDVPCVLRAVLQTLGMPLDRLLGVSVPAQHAPHHGALQLAGPAPSLTLQGRRSTGGGGSRQGQQQQPQQPQENQHQQHPHHQPPQQQQQQHPGNLGQGQGIRPANHLQQPQLPGQLAQTPAQQQHHQAPAQAQYPQPQQQQQLTQGVHVAGALPPAAAAAVGAEAGPTPPQPPQPPQPQTIHSLQAPLYGHQALLPEVSPELPPAAESPTLPVWHQQAQYPQQAQRPPNQLPPQQQQQQQPQQHQVPAGSVPAPSSAAATVWEQQQQQQQQQQRQAAYRQQHTPPQQQQQQQGLQQQYASSTASAWVQLQAQQQPTGQSQHPQQQYLQQQQYPQVQQQYPQQVQYPQQQQQPQYHHLQQQPQQQHYQQQPSYAQQPGQAQQQQPQQQLQQQQQPQQQLQQQQHQPLPQQVPYGAAGVATGPPSSHGMGMTIPPGLWPQG